MNRRHSNQSGGRNVPPTLSTPDQWRLQARPEKVITLPSGAVVRIRKLSIVDQLISGTLDLSSVQVAMNTADKLKSVEAWKELSKNEFDELKNILESAGCLALLEPRLYANDLPDKPLDGLKVSEVPFEDLLAIFNQAVRGDFTVARFPASSEKPANDPVTGRSSSTV